MDSLRSKVEELGGFGGEDAEYTATGACDIIDKIEEAVIEANAFLGELNKLDYIDCDELVVKMKEVEKSLY